MAKSGELDWETIFTDIIGLFSTMTYLASKATESGDNVRCSSWAHLKARSGLVNWTFSLVVTAEAPRAKIDRNRRFRSNAVSLTQNFR